MKRKQLGLTLIAFVLLAIGVTACSHFQDLKRITPKEQVILFMHTYNAQYDDYLAMASQPNLTKDQRDMLRKKMEILI